MPEEEEPAKTLRLWRPHRDELVYALFVAQGALQLVNECLAQRKPDAHNLFELVLNLDSLSGHFIGGGPGSYDDGDPGVYAQRADELLQCWPKDDPWAMSVEGVDYIMIENTRGDDFDEDL